MEPFQPSQDRAKPEAPRIQRAFKISAFVVLILASCFVAGITTRYALESEEFFHLDMGLSGSVLLTIVVVIFLSYLILKYSGLGLYLLMVFVYLNFSQILVRFHDMPSLLQLLVFPMALAAWTGRFAVNGERLKTGLLTCLLVLNSLVLLLSSTYAEQVDLANERFFENLKALTVYLLVVGLATSYSRIRNSVIILIGAGALLSCLALIQVISGDFRSEFGGLARIKHAHIYGTVFEPRIAGPLGDPNFFAQVLLILVPLALYTIWGTRSLKGRFILYGLAALVATATILTYSRGGAVALGFVLLLVLLEQKLNLHKFLIIVILVLAGLVLLPADFTSRLTTIQQILPGSEEQIHPDSSFEKRKLFARIAWRMFLDHPMFGVGAGNYSVHYETYADEIGSAAREYDEPDELHYPHCLYLEICAETGLMGLIVFAFIIGTAVACLRKARTRFISKGNKAMAGMARGFELALIGYLVSSIFLHGHFQRYLWLILAFSAALHSLSCEDEEECAGREYRRFDLGELVSWHQARLNGTGRRPQAHRLLRSGDR